MRSRHKVSAVYTIVSKGTLFKDTGKLEFQHGKWNLQKMKASIMKIAITRFLF